MRKSKEDDTSGIVVEVTGNVFVAGFTAGALPGRTFSGGGYDSYVLKLVPE